MARRRRNFKRKTAVARSGWGNTLGKVASVANTALKIGKFVASIVNAEKKYYDVTNSAQVTNTGNMTNLTLMSQGTTAVTRIGNSVKMKSLQVRYNIYQEATNTVSTMCRVMLVQDTSKSSYASPALSDVLESTSTAYSVLSPLTMEQPGRWRVLYDHLHTIAPPGQQGTLNHGEIFVKFDKNKKGEDYAHLLWDESGSAQADQRGHPIYAICCSDDATGGPLFTFYSRLRFYDN